jgi:hypothetical protein
MQLHSLTGPLSIPQMIHEWFWSSGGMILTRENRRTQRKSCPIATLSTINHTWTSLGAKSCFCGEKLATDPLSYGTDKKLPKQLEFASLIFSMRSTCPAHIILLDLISLKQIAEMNFLRTVCGFRLADRKRTVDIITQVKVKHLNEVAEGQRAKWWATLM